MVEKGKSDFAFLSDGFFAWWQFCLLLKIDRYKAIKIGQELIL